MAYYEAFWNTNQKHQSKLLPKILKKFNNSFYKSYFINQG
jgi:hypothetical protein